MIEIRLFGKIVESAVRQEQAAYLKKVRTQPFPQELPKVEEISEADYVKMGFWARWCYRRRLRQQRKRLKKALKAQKMPVDEQLTRGYNAGVEMTLRVLKDEYVRFMRELEKENV